MTTCLEGLAGVEADARRPARSVRLLGAAHAWREATGSLMEPAELAGYTRNLAKVRAALEPAAFAAAWAEGLRLSLEAAVELLSATEPASQPLQAMDAREPLTRREREVAALIARGLTNRQIAERLVISERTADGHVANILGKLGLKTRAQVAVWAVEHQIAPASI
jgi:non-specific serine/threonine protein kinase